MPSSETSIRLGGEQWWIVARAAEHLKVRADHVRRLAGRGKLRKRTIGGALWVAKSDVERYAGTRGFWRPGGVVGGKAALDEVGGPRRAA